MDKVAHMLN